MPGFGMYREIAAFVLDGGFAGVPSTQLARVRDYILQSAENDPPPATSKRLSHSSDYKVCSVQSYVNNICSAEDMGPSKFSKEDVQRIAALDIRLCNLDRHEGNLLVVPANPYRRLDWPASPALDLHDDMFACELDSGLRQDGEAQPGVRLVAAGTHSGGLEAGSALYQLVPIDHGYVLPHVLYMTDPSLSWINWPQVDEPITGTVRRYIQSLNYARDAELLRRVVGAALPETSLLTLQVCTMYLKKGAAAGLTLRELGEGMCPNVDEVLEHSRRLRSGMRTPIPISPLQKAVHLAVLGAAARTEVEEPALRPLGAQRSSPRLHRASRSTKSPLTTVSHAKISAHSSSKLLSSLGSPMSLDSPRDFEDALSRLGIGSAASSIPPAGQQDPDTSSLSSSSRSMHSLWEGRPLSRSPGSLLASTARATEADLGLALTLPREQLALEFDSALDLLIDELIALR